MRYLLLVAFIALGFASCKKEDSNPGPDTSSRQLKKITRTENGEVIVYNLTYDASKRLTSIKSADNSEITILTYDAAGNLSSIDETEEEFHNIYTYTYAAGIPVSASFKSWQKHAGEPDELIEDDILTYTVESGKVTGIQMEMMDGSEVEFALTYANGNLTKVNSVGNEFYSATFTYGTKKSPYPQAAKYILDHAGFSLMLFAKNEVITTVYDFPGTMLDKTVTAQYTYDAAGYPTVSNDGDVELKFEYQ